MSLMKGMIAPSAGSLVLCDSLKKAFYKSYSLGFAFHDGRGSLWRLLKKL